MYLCYVLMLGDVLEHVLMLSYVLKTCIVVTVVVVSNEGGTIKTLYWLIRARN